MINVMVPTGSLGVGLREADVRAGLAMGAHAIAADAGSTDSGPYYLASGVSKYSRDAIKGDLSILMQARAEAGIPLLVGSCATSGCDKALHWTYEIVREIAAETGTNPRIALLSSEQDAATLERKIAEGQVHPLPPLGPLDSATVRDCSHIVALMGPEPYIAALQAGADIVLGGRTTDTAVLAAVPIMHGMGLGPAWHAGKIAECGGLCTIDPTGSGVMMRVADEAFEIEPLSPDNRCTPETVSAHMLYENGDPFRLVEPGGVLDVTDARYVALDDRVVRVTGSRWEPKPYTMKLEGASPGPFQTIMLVGIMDPRVLAAPDAFLQRMHTALTRRVRQAIGAEAEPYDISLRPYGWNAMTGEPVPPGAPAPREIGLLFVATAATQALATRIAKTCNPLFFHLPAAANIEMPSYGFPFSPAEIERGQVFAFRLNHVVAVRDGMELVRTSWPNGAAARAAA